MLEYALTPEMAAPIGRTASVTFILSSSFDPLFRLNMISLSDGLPRNLYMTTVMPQHRRHTNAAITVVLSLDFHSLDTIESANRYSSPSSGSVRDANVRVPLI